MLCEENTINLETLSFQLSRVSSIDAKIAILNTHPSVQQFIRLNEYTKLFDQIPPSLELILKQLIAIRQLDSILLGELLDSELLLNCLEKLSAVDLFYAELGGIVGYQSKILSCLKSSSKSEKPLGIAYHPPSFISIEEETDLVDEAILIGIESLPYIAEMYPLGGAADRLHLMDEITGEELPAANLPYHGRSLLCGLIRDLQAREFLYFQLKRKQLTTPVAIMTSLEKNNHHHLLAICEKADWFGRPKDSFRFFIQPLVPTVGINGNWCVHAPFKPLLKPGGHGVIWKLARDFGIFEWFEQLGKTKAVIRQINNPMTSLDYGLLAFVGLGFKNKMIFGFASCPRLLQSAEGVNVVIEKETGEIVLTNIEYCDFEKFGIEDLPIKEGEPYSRFSSNTNILFVDLKEVARAVEITPFPGLLINLKKATFMTDTGERKESTVARLESTMQNIADVFVEKKTDSFITKKTFVTYNRRHKTISTVKKALSPGRSLEETPENCFYVQMQAARELLEKDCSMLLPSPFSLSTYLEKGPDFVFLYHPSLGPLYSIIRQKIRGGTIAPQSEMQLEISDMELENLNLKGSLLVEAERPMGHLDQDGLLCYSDELGSCILKNIKIENRGVDWMKSGSFWKNQFCRKEAVRIVLKGHSRFIAENVEFYGAHEFIVPDGVQMRVIQEKNKIRIEKTKFTASPIWTYTLQENRVKLRSNVSE